MPVAIQTQLIVYDILGREVKTIVNDVLHAGEHFVQWDGTNGVRSAGRQRRVLRPHDRRSVREDDEDDAHAVTWTGRVQVMWYHCIRREL